MYSLVNSLKRALVFGVFGMAVLFGASIAANAQSDYHEHYYQQSHRKAEKRALKRHQRRERFLYGNSRALRRHQKLERKRLKRHQRFERRYGYDDDRGRFGDRRRRAYFFIRP